MFDKFSLEKDIEYNNSVRNEQDKNIVDDWGEEKIYKNRKNNQNKLLQNLQEEPNIITGNKGHINIAKKDIKINKFGTKFKN